MGLGLNLRVDGGSELLRRQAPSDFAKEFGRAFAIEAKEAAPLLGPSMRMFRVADGFELHVHPAEEPVRLELTGDRLVVSARTNGAGPGYHAYLVDCLEGAAKRCGATLFGGDPDGAFADETGYLASRDFAALQASMTGWVAALADQLRDHDLEGIRISLPVDAPSVLDAGGAVTPMGVRNREWVLELASASEQRQRELAAGFFPWWERGFNAQAHLGLALHLAWVHVRWHPPADPRERQQLKLVLEAFDKARSLGAAVPDVEVQELRALLAQRPTDAAPPRETGIGYLRGRVRWFLTEGWSVELPGYWYTQVEEDDTWVASFGERTVRLRPSNSAQHEAPASGERLASSTEVTRELDAEGRSTYVLSGHLMAGGEQCLVVVRFPRQEDLSWAEAVWRSVSNTQR